MNNKNILLILNVLFLISIFGSCKKGFEDPLLSLRSRKARVAGKWHLSYGTENIDSNLLNGAYKSSLKLTFTDQKLDAKYSSDSTNWSYTKTGTVSMQYIFKRNGTFTIDAEKKVDGLYTQTITQSGKWNFEAGVGTLKNKEFLVLNLTNNKILTSNALGDYIETNITSSNAPIRYQIIGLRNKSLHLTRENAEQINTTNNSFSYLNTFNTFEDLYFEQ